MRTQIDSLSSIDLASVSLSDIQWMFGTGVDIVTGNGRNKKLRYRSGVMTSLGDIELSIWVQLAKLILKRDALTDEWQNLIEYLESTNAYCRDKIITLDVFALQLCVSRIDLNPRWVSYALYNRNYHPERLV